MKEQEFQRKLIEAIGGIEIQLQDLNDNLENIDRRLHNME